MDRASEKLEEARYFTERAADAMLHLDRARKARLRSKGTYSQPDYGSMRDYYHFLSEAQAILTEFHRSRIEVPQYLSDEWMNVIQAGRK